MTVHVSIHDVSPKFEDAIERALLACHRNGAKPSLLVVPDFHGESLLTDHPRFVDRLKELASGGHEVILHGYAHRADGDAPGFGVSRFVAQRVVSNGEAEFSSLSEAAARSRIDDGIRVLRDARLTPVGFIPPAWSMPKWLLPVLAEKGFRYTEDHLFVFDPVAKTSRPSVVLNYAGRTKARMLSTVAYCRVARYARALVPARIALHPGDMNVPLLAREVESLLRWGRGDYDDRVASLVRS